MITCLNNNSFQSTYGHYSSNSGRLKLYPIDFTMDGYVMDLVATDYVKKTKILERNKNKTLIKLLIKHHLVFLLRDFML